MAPAHCEDTLIESLPASTLSRPASQSVSVVVPAYNEAEHIAEGLRELQAVMRSTGWEYEILVVDDGSEDGTAEAASTVGVRVLRTPTNRGYGASLKAGIRCAQHPWILITDADGTYPTADMVVGARTGTTVKIPWLRRPPKAFLRWLASYLAEQDLPDINSGLRLMHRDLIARYEHLLPNGFSFTTTITLAAACNGHVVTYIPINYFARQGTSKIRPRHAFDFALLTVRTVVFFNPLRVFLPLGGFLAVAGLAKLVYDITRNNLSESAVLALLGALVVWAVGLLADQNAQLASSR